MNSKIKKTMSLGENVLLSLTTTVVCLILLCVLVVWGTFYQIDNGMYAAKSYLFDAWIVLVAGVIPFPGVRLIGSILIVNLLGMLLRRQSWKWRKAGSIVAHAGVLVLLIGGGIISYTSRETYLSLWEGERSHEASLYHAWELAVRSTPSPSGAQGLRRAVGLDTLAVGRRYSLSPVAMTLSVEAVYKNCSAISLGRNPPRDACVDSLVALPAESDVSKNIPGAVVRVQAAEGAPSPPILLYGASPLPVLRAAGGDSLFLELRPARIPLPLTVTLLQFVKVDYAGTQTAKEYKSKIHVAARDLERDVVISMNNPFRYRQFTFYQSSFEQRGGKTASTFAVVENRGRALPYVASVLMALGLLIHFLLAFAGHVRAHRSARS